MENATEALKIILGVAIFAVAFTLLFRTASLARYTAEFLITGKDQTTYYSYYDENQAPTVKHDGTSEDKNSAAKGLVNRLVTLEEIIPTIYRYSEESYAVTIIDKDNSVNNHGIVARFDRETELFCSSYASKSHDERRKLVQHINKCVLRPIGTKGSNYIQYNTTEFMGVINVSNDGLEELFKNIYNQQSNNYFKDNINCPWSRAEEIALRIDSDLSRKKSCI